MTIQQFAFMFFGGCCLLGILGKILDFRDWLKRRRGTMASFYLKSWDVFSWDVSKSGLYVLRNDCSFTLDTDFGKRYTIHCKRGLAWDGASVPKPFRWYLPNIDEKNLVYTSAGLLHDCCYGAELLPKPLSDDLFRGVLRDAGILRRKASFAHLCVKFGAKSHYGKEHDRFGIRFFCSIEETPA